MFLKIIHMVQTVTTEKKVNNEKNIKLILFYVRNWHLLFKLLALSIKHFASIGLVDIKIVETMGFHLERTCPSKYCKIIF